MTPTHHHPSGRQITVLSDNGRTARVHDHTMGRDEIWWSHELAAYAKGPGPPREVDGIPFDVQLRPGCVAPHGGN